MNFDLLVRVSFLASLLVFVLLFSWNATSYRKESIAILSQSLSNSEPKQDSVSISISAYNDYTKVTPITDEYPWNIIVEPYRATEFTATVSGVSSSATVTYFWDFDGTFAYDNPIYLTMNDTGLMSASLTLTIESEEGDVSSFVQTFEVMRRYVRREIRSLTDVDREHFFEAMHAVYTLTTDEGRLLYGENFRNIQYFMDEHLQGAAQKTCDHWHDDAGIMTHHMAFTLEFEQNLQRVHPRISMPYWEYSYDAYIYGTNWTQSPIFDPSWFGTAHPNNELRTVTEGRWAYLPVASATDSTKISNPYGLLRSPWNLNPVPYVGRHDTVLDVSPFTTLPECKIFGLAFESTTIAELNVYLNGVTHGPVHIMVGGHWGIDNKDIKDLFSEDIFSVLLVSKNFWRQGFARCPDECDAESSESCTCSCPLFSNGQMSAYDMLITANQMWYLDVMSEAIYYDTESGLYKIQGYSPSKETETWNSILEGICSFGHAGEMFSSAAPYDPLFWVIHTSAERFLQFRRIYSIKGEKNLNETWGYDHSLEVIPSDTGMICDWSKCVTDSDMPVCKYKTCIGHYADDLLPQTNLLEEQSTYTNIQFYEFMNPMSDYLPYIYDSFSWDHCTEQGIVF